MRRPALVPLGAVLTAALVTGVAGGVTAGTARPATPRAAVYRLDLTGVHVAGRYRVEVVGGATARSPWFSVRGPSNIFGALLRAGVAFDRNQRDGANVVAGQVDRQPSHLNDAQAGIYRWPRMEHGSDLIL